MGRNSSNKKPGRTLKEAMAWPDEDEPDWIPNRGRIGRRGTSVRFVEIRLKDSFLEMDYQFNAGGGHLWGTMTLAYEDGDALAQVADKLAKLGEEAFHNMRRARD